MISFTSNFKDVLNDIVGKLGSINELNGPGRDKILRAVASDTITQLHERIHVEGKNTEGIEFGEYSNAYLKRRKKNGLSGSKIILRFEGQLEKLTIVANENGKYSIGWLSEFNRQKADWMENGTKDHTVEEHERVIGRKSEKSRNKTYDSIARIEDEIADGDHSPDELIRLNKRLASARKRYEKAQGRSVTVKSHQRSGHPGYGKIWSLSPAESAHAAAVAEDMVKQILES